jgi:hypothetical protein
MNKRRQENGGSYQGAVMVYLGGRAGVASLLWGASFILSLCDLATSLHEDLFSRRFWTTLLLGFAWLVTLYGLIAERRKIRREN